MVSALDISREIGNTDDIKRNAKVVAFEDLPGVPEGTKGKVALVGGFDKWIRYYVNFENGVGLSSINRPFLAPAKQYDTLVAKRTAAVDSGVFDVVATAATAGGDDAGDAGAAAAGGVTINGVDVPAHLIQRSADARVRLGV